jgi:hypothetical protein
MPIIRGGTDLVEELRLPVGGSFIITDELGNELFRVTAAGDAVKIGGVTIDGDSLALTDLTASAAELNTLDGITATVDELNLLAGAGAAVASGTAHAHIADIANDADGTAIATAVNGILDVLEAFGEAATS